MLEILKVGQVAIPVKDLESSLAFYRDTLGLEFLFQAPPGLAFFRCGEVRIMIESIPENRGEARSSVVYFQVADIQSAYKALAGQGVEFAGEPHLISKMPDHDLWMAFFHDPSDNLLALMAEVPVQIE